MSVNTGELCEPPEPPDVVKEEIGNWDEAVAFYDSPSNAFAPLNVH